MTGMHNDSLTTFDWQTAIKFIAAIGFTNQAFGI